MNPCALPETGTELLPLVAVAVVLLVAGLIALLATRRGRAWFAAAAVTALVVGGLAVSPALPASAADCTPAPAPAVVNHAPLAVDGASGIVEDGEGDTVTGDLLVDATDEDGDTLTVTTTGTFTLDYGTLAVDADGTYTYTLDNTNPALDDLDEGETLTDTFTFTISDGRGGTASATLTITISGTTDNRAPTGNPDAGSIKEDTAPNPISGNVLTNDTDPDGDSLTVTNAAVYALSYGLLNIHTDGSFTYTLDNTNATVNGLNDGQSLVEAFSYNVSDGRGGTASALLTVTIHGTTDVNNPPDVVSDTNTIREDSTPNTVSGNVLANDSDPDSHAMTVANAGTITLQYGSLEIHADGSYTYTLDNSNPAVDALNNGQSLTDTFTYVASDGHGGSSSTTLTIRIDGTTDNQAPDAFSDSNTIQEDATPNTVSGNVLANDFDSNGHMLAVANAGTITLQYGSLVIHADGSYTYTLDNSNPAVDALDNGQQLADMFVYVVSDGHGGTSSSSLTIRIDGATDAVP